MTFLFSYFWQLENDGAFCLQVPNCDTLHALIREHRDAHKVPLNLEHRLMLAMAPDYDHLPLVNKVSHKLDSGFNSFFASILDWEVSEICEF